MKIAIGAINEAGIPIKKTIDNGSRYKMVISNYFTYTIRHYLSDE